MARGEIDPQLPFIQLHRSAPNKCATLATLYEVSVPHMVGAMSLFWMDLADRRVIRKMLQATGHFVLSAEEVSAKLRMAIGKQIQLADFVLVGFLEPVGPDSYRVRGMSAYLDAERKRMRLRKVYFNPPSTPVEPRLNPGEDERSTADSTSKKETDCGSPSKTATKVLTDALVATYKAIRGENYLFQVKDGVAVAKLRELATHETILERWSTGLKGDGWFRVSTIAQMLQKWNDLAGGPPRPTKSEPAAPEPPPLRRYTDEELENLYRPGGVHGPKRNQA